MATRSRQVFDQQWQLIEETTLEVPAEETNAADLRTKALAALDANATYLALANPTNAENLAQIRRLTRECSGLIRLLLGRLDDTAGT